MTLRKEGLLGGDGMLLLFLRAWSLLSCRPEAVNASAVTVPIRRRFDYLSMNVLGVGFPPPSSTLHDIRLS